VLAFVTWLDGRVHAVPDALTIDRARFAPPLAAVGS
jgi:hypothetical protein